MMGEGLYVLGIEPINWAANENRASKDEQKLMPILEAGQSGSYALEIEVVEYP
jgi:hypothetical protein